VKLVFGEESQTYPAPASPKGPYRGGATKTTVSVAKILEAKYELVETFFNVYYDKIIEALAEDFADELDFEFNGRARRRANYNEAIAELFREFIESGNVGRVGIPGTPTAIARQQHRPSFWDTGLFKDNARFWIEK
jgi:hypothetical protein